MTSESVQKELQQRPFLPLRLHLASGRKMDIPYSGTAWLRQNTLLIVHPLAPITVTIGGYDVIALRLIERIEQIGPKSKRRRDG